MWSQRGARPSLVLTMIKDGPPLVNVADIPVIKSLFVEPQVILTNLLSQRRVGNVIDVAHRQKITPPGPWCRCLQNFSEIEQERGYKVESFCRRNRWLHRRCSEVSSPGMPLTAVFLSCSGKEVAKLDIWWSEAILSALIVTSCDTGRFRNSLIILTRSLKS